MKRKYTLSEAALAQRRRVSPFAARKRDAEAPRANADTLAVQVQTMRALAAEEFDRMFAPLPKDAPNSEHQRRAALIRMHKLRNGELSGSSRGGRHKVSRSCAQCGSSCDSAREARDHCRVTRKLVSE